MDTAATEAPGIQRSRPIDATGWFWSLVLLLAGLFYSHLGHIWTVIGLVLLLASPVCFIWQFKKWRNDSAINRQATAWCRKFYVSYGGSPIVDLMVAIAHDTDCSFHHITPYTGLDELNWIAEDDKDIYWGTDYSNRHQVWLSSVVRDARIPNVDPSEFSGSTLDDAVRFVAKSCTIG